MELLQPCLDDSSLPLLHVGEGRRTQTKVASISYRHWIYRFGCLVVVSIGKDTESGSSERPWDCPSTLSRSKAARETATENPVADGQIETTDVITRSSRPSKITNQAVYNHYVSCVLFESLIEVIMVDHLE